MKLKSLAVVGGLLAIALVFLFVPSNLQKSPQDAPMADSASNELWTCPMHPQVQVPDKVPCPLCGMELVAASDAQSEVLVLTPSEVALARVASTPVTRRSAEHEVRLVGMVATDEAKVTVVAARVGGRLERVFIDYAGVRVQRGDHLVELYSPTLLAAQEELLAAAKRRTGEGSLAASFESAYALAREKLGLFGLDEEQLDALEVSGVASDQIVIHSRTSGTVMKLFTEEGEYVSEGSPLLEIADLGHVWVELEAYEQDLPWLRYGQRVSIQIEALPGESLTGTVSFLEPEVDRSTRTSTVRVSLENPGQKLKPGMFARAQVHASIGPNGAALPADLAGKWISPMHPEVIHDAPGACDICGMDLVPAEDLGLTASAAGHPLVVPVSAVLPTGKRALVYVEEPWTGGLRYVPREVVLGPRAGEFYLVKDGLDLGERVVVRGAFRIDSAMQIRGLESSIDFMAPAGASANHHRSSAALRVSMDAFWAGVLDLSQALAEERDVQAIELAGALPSRLDQARWGSLQGRAKQVQGELWPDLVATTDRVSEAQDVDELRASLVAFFLAALPVADAFGVPGVGGAREVFCPMANEGQGASWMQREGAIANPYFGSAMLRCGDNLRSLGVE